MVVIKREATLLVVTEKGLGKCSHIDEYRVQKRGGKGILTLNRTEKTGDVVALMEVWPRTSSCSSRGRASPSASR
jgi:DNA gyrase subunit A